jgi:ABC-type Fe3+-siderophore transport system permease subunit
MGNSNDGSGAFLFFLAALLFVIAVIYAMFMAFKRGESLTPNDKFSIHRTYWLFLVAFGFLFFAVIVATSGSGSETASCSSRKSKKSTKSGCGSKSASSYSSKEYSSPKYEGDSYDRDDEEDEDDEDEYDQTGSDL